MPSTKKPASSKRASLPRSADYAKSFVKDWERLSRSGRYNMRQLKEVMLLLIANDEPLGPEWLDHALKGAPWESLQYYPLRDFWRDGKQMISA